MTARKAVLSLRGHAGRILIAASAAEPRAILEAALAEPGLLAGRTLTGAFIPGVNETGFAAAVPGGRVETIFATAGLARGGGGTVAHLPLHYSAFWARLARPGLVGAVVATVPPPRADGSFGLGLACDFAPAAIAAGAALIEIVNARMPDVAQGPRLPAARFAALVEDDSPLPELVPAIPDRVNMAIADHVAALIGPGATLQLGLGRLQAAILARLAQHPPSGLACHAGMIVPGVLAPGLFPRGIVTGVALGDAAFYDAVGRAPGLRLAPVGETHAHAVLAAQPGLISVNAALEVDLSGQVNAEYLGAQSSGQGGMVDFIRGARASAQGRSIIALPATARGGRQSRIVAALGAGVPVSVARGDIDMVVTEHGTADLREADLATRARALAGIAAPEFRDDLLAAAARMR